MSVMVIRTMSWQEKVDSLTYPLARSPRRPLPSMSLIPSAPFTRLRAGFGAAGNIALMTKQVASWCETVGSGPVCDE